MADLKAQIEKLKNIKLTKEQQQSVVLGIVVAGGLVYGYWNYVLGPLNQDIIKLTDQVNAKRKNLEEARRMQGQWEEYNQRMSRVQTAESYAARRMPPAGEITASIARMIKLTLEGNVWIQGYRAEDRRGAAAKSEFPGFEKQVATITVKGGYHRLGAFLSRLSGEDLVFNIEDMKLQALTDSLDEAARRTAGIEVKLVTYSEMTQVKK